jgi:hypothetical protein
MTIEEHLRALACRIAASEDPDLGQLLTEAADAVRMRAEESPGERRMAEMLFDLLGAIEAGERRIASHRRYTDEELCEAAEAHGGCRAAGRALGLAHSTISRALRRHNAAAKTDISNDC